MIAFLVVLHVLAGSVAIAGMLCALFVKKGGAWHKRGGRAYVGGMGISLTMAIIVSIMTSNIFLLLIAVFSSYLVYTGLRLAIVRDGKRTSVDQRISLLMLVVAGLMIAYGLYMFFVGQNLGVALVVFGFLGGGPAWQDYLCEANWPRGKERIVLHLGRMGGASIASITAVFVVNIQTNPAFIAWLLPTVVGAPLIIYWSRRTLSGGASK